MAAAFNEVTHINKPVPIQAAFYALSVMQDTVKAAFPEAEEVTVTLEGSGALRIAIMTHSLTSPSEIIFALNRHLVPGYRFGKVAHNREFRSTGRNVVTALVEMH